MTLHFMPALWLDDGGLEITESIVITESGYESLANVEQRLAGEIIWLNPISTNIDFERDGLQHGFLKIPHSRNDSAWGSIMLPISYAKNGDGPAAIPDRCKPRR